MTVETRLIRAFKIGEREGDGSNRQVDDHVSYFIEHFVVIRVKLGKWKDLERTIKAKRTMMRVEV